MIEKLGPLEKMFSDDLNDGSFSGEIHQWYLKWESVKNNHGLDAIPTSLSHTLPHVSSYYPNINKFSCKSCVHLPVTSCSSERSFSALKRIKTSIRSSMGNEKLTALTLLHIHRDVEIDVEEVIDEFGRRYPRRMKLANILQDQ